MVLLRDRPPQRVAKLLGVGVKVGNVGLGRGDLLLEAREVGLGIGKQVAQLAADHQAGPGRKLRRVADDVDQVSIDAQPLDAGAQRH